MERILIAENNIIEWLGLQNAVTEDYDNLATVDATLKDSDNVPVTGLIDIKLSYVNGSDGIYRGTFRAIYTDALTEGTKYFLEITASGTASAFRRLELIAVYHSAG